MSLDAVDRRHVWALAQRRGDERVSLQRSVDGGRNWSEKPGLTFASISMADVHDGWAVTGAGPSGFTSEPRLGGEGTLTRTATGGRTWSVVPVSAQSVCAVSDSVAWAASRTTVLRTLDDGRTWSFDRLYSPRFYFTGDIGCASASVAWDLALGDGSMSQQQYLASRTLDGGATWTPMLHESFFPLPPKVARVRDQIDAYAGAFTVPSPTSAFFLGTCDACGTTSITTTTDAGRSFEHTRLAAWGRRSERPEAISFINARRGWVLVGSPAGAALLRTNDGGRTWHRIARF